MKPTEVKNLSLTREIVRTLHPNPEVHRSALEAVLKFNLLHELDSSEIRILPQIVARTKLLNISNPQLDLIEKILEPFNRKTAHLQNNFAEPVRLCNELQISPVLLKGAALWKEYPSYCSARRMTDIDILVPFGRKLEVFEYFEKNGWKFSKKFKKSDTDWRTGFPFSSSKLGILVDLHWAIIPEDLNPDTTALFFETSSRVCDKNLEFQIPKAEMLYYHAMLNGNRYGDVGSRMQWILDSALILQHVPQLDWNLLFGLGVRAEALLAFRDSILMFQKLGLVIPENILERIQAHKPNSRELFQYQITQFPTPRLRALKLTELIRFLINFYHLWRFRFSLCGKKLGLFSFLKYFTHTQSLGDMLGVLIKFLKIRRRV